MPVGAPRVQEDEAAGRVGLVVADVLDEGGQGVAERRVGIQEGVQGL